MVLYTLFCHAILYVMVTARPRQYQRQGHSACPTKVLFNAPGEITSPGYPDHYAANTKCTWTIMAPQNALVMLEFISFDIKSGSSCDVTRRCQCDYVQIREVKRGPKHKYARKFCEGHYPKGVISTTSNKVRVHFKSNDFSEGKGFVLKYWFENKPLNRSPLDVNRSGSAKPIKLSTDVTHDRVTSHEQLSAKVKDGRNRGIPPSSNTGIQAAPPSNKRSIRAAPPSNNRGIRAAPPSNKRGIRAAPLSNKRGIRAAPPSNNSGVVVKYHEDKEKAKKAEEEADPPDAIVLGPAVPIILIFLGVVASITWWQFRSDQKERLRYYKEQIRYEEISKRSKRGGFKKKKQSLREVRMKKLYGDMARHWQGTQTCGAAPPSDSRQTKRSFAGRLLELAEKPVSYIRTPRGSRPSSVLVQAEQGEPLVVMREKKDKPGGHRPPSRPASVLLRDALNMIFGATSTPQDNASEPKEPGSQNDSKRASLKRVSFYDMVVEKMADVKESEDEQNVAAETAKPPEKPKKPKPEPLLIPHIMVRQPSCESGESDAEAHRKTRETVTNADEPSADSKDGPRPEPELEPEQSITQESAPSTEQQPLLDDLELEQDSQRPRSFEKKLVEMLEVLRNEKDEFPEDDVDTDVEQSFASDDQGEPSPPPVPHQTPVPRDNGSPASPYGKTNCADLEDFLLNLDKELEDEDGP